MMKNHIIEVHSSSFSIDSKEVIPLVKGAIISLADIADSYSDYPPTAIKTAKAFAGFVKGLEELPDLPSEFWANALRCTYEILGIVKDDQEALKKESSRRATDAQYKQRRKLSEDAESVARNLYENGSNLRHHEMKVYLAKEYKDESGTNPFKDLPDKTLLRACRKAAKSSGRLDLITGTSQKIEEK